MQTKTWTTSDLERLAKKAPNDRVAAAIRGGALDSIGEGDTIFTRPGLSQKRIAELLTRDLRASAGGTTPTAPAVTTKAPTREATSATPVPTRTESPEAAVRSARENAMASFNSFWFDDDSGSEAKSTVPHVDPALERDAAIALERKKLEERRQEQQKETARLARGELTETERAVQSFNDL